MLKANSERRERCRDFIDIEDIVPTVRTYFENDMNLCLIGYPGIGKTTLFEQLAGGPENLRTVIGSRMHLSDLVGPMTLKADQSVWQDGHLVEAMKRGLTFYADELSGFDDDCVRSIHAVMDHRRELYVAGNSETVKAHPSFRLICSDNYSSSGIPSHTRQFRDRLIHVYMNRLDRDTEMKLLIDRYCIDVEDAEWLMMFASATRRVDTEGGASTRQLEKSLTLTDFKPRFLDTSR